MKTIRTWTVFRVSLKWNSAGVTHAIMYVIAFPPSESCRRRVSFESRYDTWDPACREDSWEITLPKLANPALIEIPSFALSPWACVFYASQILWCVDNPVESTFKRSLPARSTKCILLSTVMKPSWFISTGIDIRFIALSSLFFLCTRFKLKTACEREDLALIAVASVCRIEDPKFKAPRRSSTVLISTCRNPVSNMRPFVSSLMVIGARSSGLVPSGSRRSRKDSL